MMGLVLLRNSSYIRTPYHYYYDDDDDDDGWRYIVAFAKVLTMYHSLHHSPLCPSHSWNSFSTGIIFPFIYMCTQYLHYIHLLCPFPTSSPFPLPPIPTTQT
jgi:hypothetical protein